MEQLIKAVADSGAKVIVSGAAVGEMALHFCERYKYVILCLSTFIGFVIISSMLIHEIGYLLHKIT